MANNLILEAIAVLDGDSGLSTETLTLDGAGHVGLAGMLEWLCERGVFGWLTKVWFEGGSRFPSGFIGVFMGILV